MDAAFQSGMDSAFQSGMDAAFQSGVGSGTGEKNHNGTASCGMDKALLN